MAHELSYGKVYKPLATVCGLGPARSSVRVADGALLVRVGWAFAAEIPLGNIRAAIPAPPAPWYWGAGVHVVGKGKWIVNGTLGNLVEITIDPPVAVRSGPIHPKVNTLIVSVEDPPALIAALRPVG